MFTSPTDPFRILKVIHIHSSVDGRLGCFHVLAIVKRAAMKLGYIDTSLSIMVFSGYMPGNGIVGSYGNSSIPSFFKKSPYCFP